MSNFFPGTQHKGQNIYKNICVCDSSNRYSLIMTGFPTCGAGFTRVLIPFVITVVTAITLQGLVDARRVTAVKHTWDAWPCKGGDEINMYTK